LQIGIFGKTSTQTLPPRILPPPRNGIVVLANFEIPPGILGGGLGGRVKVCSWPPRTVFFFVIILIKKYYTATHHGQQQS